MTLTVLESIRVAVANREGGAMLDYPSYTKGKKVEVYSLVYLARRATHPPSHNYPLVTGPVHSQAFSIAREAYSSAAISGAQNYSNTQAFTVLPGTHLLLGRESAECTCGQSALPRSTTSERNSAQPGDRTRDLSLVSRVRYHWVTMPTYHTKQRRQPT